MSRQSPPLSPDAVPDPAWPLQASRKAEGQRLRPTLHLPPHYIRFIKAAAATTHGRASGHPRCSVIAPAVSARTTAAAEKASPPEGPPASGPKVAPYGASHRALGQKLRRTSRSYSALSSRGAHLASMALGRTPGGSCRDGGGAEGACKATWGLWGLPRLPLPVLRAERGRAAGCRDAWGQSWAFLNSLQCAPELSRGGAPEFQSSKQCVRSHG